MRFSTSRDSAEHRHLAREYEEHPGYPALQKCKYQSGVRYGIHDSVSDDFQELFEIHNPEVDELD